MFVNMFMQWAHRLRSLTLLLCCFSTATAGQWDPVLQYSKDSWVRQTGAAGKVTGVPSDPFAKLSDDAINAIPPYTDGYFYFKLTSSGDNSVLIRTHKPYVGN